MAPTGVDEAKTAKCFRIAERDRGVTNREVASANDAGAFEMKWSVVILHYF